MLQLILFVVIALLTVGQLFDSPKQSGGSVSTIYNMVKGGGKSRKGKR
jgi:hypothetical protein